MSHDYYYEDVPERIFRKATRGEVNLRLARQDHIRMLEKRIEQDKQKLEELRKGCDHRVIKVKPGFTYNIHECFVCGKSDLV